MAFKFVISNGDRGASDTLAITSLISLYTFKFSFQWICTSPEQNLRPYCEIAFFPTIQKKFPTYHPYYFSEYLSSVQRLVRRLTVSIFGFTNNYLGLW